MKILVLGLLAISMTTFSALAQDFLKCDFKISDNSVDCPLLGKCPQKILRESTTSFGFELSEGEIIEGSIPLIKVVLLDKKDKEKDDQITLFKDDEKSSKLSELKLNLASYDSPSSLEYSIRKEGDTVYVNLDTQNYLNIWLRGHITYTGWIATQKNVITLSCEQMTRGIYQEYKAKKEALELYRTQKAQAKSAKAQ